MWDTVCVQWAQTCACINSPTVSYAHARALPCHSQLFPTKLHKRTQHETPYLNNTSQLRGVAAICLFVLMRVVRAGKLCTCEKAVHTLQRRGKNISFPQAGHDQLTHGIAFELSREICWRSDQYRENIDAAGCAGRTKQSKSC